MQQLGLINEVYAIRLFFVLTIQSLWKSIHSCIQGINSKMKILFILFTFLQIFALPSFAQLVSVRDSADYVIKTFSIPDTIHVRGKLTTPNGEPANGITVWLKSAKYFYEEAPKSVTDSLGNYRIEYIEPGDTLHIMGLYLQQTVPVMGSRIINLTVKDSSNWTMDTIQISSKGKRTKTSVLYQAKIPEGFNCSFYLPPTPAGGISGFQKHLKQHVIYPQEALDHGIEGLVSITFEISAKGEPVNFRVRRGLGYGCEEAVIAAVKSIPWKPSIAVGSVTNFEMEATLNFAIE